jgi:adenosine kinase
MSSRVLISGSVAYDTIMVFEGRFKDQILPDRVHMLNVAFLAPTMKREFGGCAANIAFNLRSLAGAAILASVGRDGDDDLDRPARPRHRHRPRPGGSRKPSPPRPSSPPTWTNNQITAFHPGAMGHAHEVDARAAFPAAWGIVAPNGKAAMLAHARAFSEGGVPWIFDPGQGLPMFDGGELRDLIESATAVTVNDYESQMLADRTGWSEAQIASKVRAMIVTRGAEGSTLYENGHTTQVASVAITRAVDPTGCGDAYRGGLLFGLALRMGLDPRRPAGSVMGAIKIEHPGPQNHAPSLSAVSGRYQQAWENRCRPDPAQDRTDSPSECAVRVRGQSAEPLR